MKYLKKVFILLILQSICFFASYGYTPQEMLDMILHEPKKVLAMNVEFRNKLQWAERCGMIQELPELQSYFEFLTRFGMKYPLFLFSECCSPECTLSRCNDECRTNYETMIARALLDSMHRFPDRPVNFVSFGCGGLLTDLIILAKTLAEKPDAQLVLHLIDNTLAPYVYHLQAISDDRMMAGVPIDLSLKHNLDKFINNTRTQWPTDSNLYTVISQLPDEAICHISRAMIGLNDMTIKQFENFLKINFPMSRITIFLHPCALSYLKYIKAKEMPQADIIAAIDLEDAESQSTKALPNYCHLVTKIHEINPMCLDFLCSYSKKEKHGIIKRIEFTTDVDGSIKKKFIKID